MLQKQHCLQADSHHQTAADIDTYTHTRMICHDMCLCVCVCVGLTLHLLFLSCFSLPPSLLALATSMGVCVKCEFCTHIFSGLLYVSLNFTIYLFRSYFVQCYFRLNFVAMNSQCCELFSISIHVELNVCHAYSQYKYIEIRLL